jgi:hypothetical protein
MDELDRVQVTRPCPLAKDPVGPGGGHCDHCQETVVDLSRMPRAEAVALVRAGARCVRMERGPDGRVRTLVRAAAVATALAACAGQPELVEPVGEAVELGPELLLRVVDGAGAPIAGANVYELELPPEGLGPLASSGHLFTDERGEAPVRPGRTLWVDAPGFVAREVDEVELINEGWEMSLLTEEEDAEDQRVRHLLMQLGGYGVE